MNREIEFRAKRKDNGEWVCGQVFVESEDSVWIIKGGFVDVDDRSCNISVKVDYMICGSIYEVIPETVGKFTGFYDKNGKKIYRGDVIKDEYGRFLTVEWDELFGCWKFGDRRLTDFGNPDFWLMKIEVVANKYDDYGICFENCNK